MKQILVGVVLALALNASPASALTIGDANYIGNAVDGAPASEAAAVTYINSLLDLPAGAAPVACSQAPSEQCNRIGSTLDVSSFPDATVVGAVKNDSDQNAIDVTGFTYLLAKYGSQQAGDFVWYVANLTGVQFVPTHAGTCGNNEGCGLSNTVLFNPIAPPTNVPDGGSTLSLLGFAMLGLGYARRRLAL